MNSKLLEIGIEELMPDPSQPRKTFLRDEIEQLAASIRSRGMLLPLRVLWDEERQAWRILTGECRWRAAKLVGLTLVPCLPVEGGISEAEILADQIIENTIRHALPPMDEARALAKLKALRGGTAQQLASELGISGSAITRAEALLSLPEPIQAMVDDGRIPESSAYEISRLPEPAAQMELAHAVASGALSRDQTAESVRSRIGKRAGRPKASRLACRLSGGINVTVSAGQPLTWDEFHAALEQLRRAAKKACESGKELSALAQVLRGTG